MFVFIHIALCLFSPLGVKVWASSKNSVPRRCGKLIQSHELAGNYTAVQPVVIL